MGAGGGAGGRSLGAEWEGVCVQEGGQRVWGCGVGVPEAGPGKETRSWVIPGGSEQQPRGHVHLNSCEPEGGGYAAWCLFFKTGSAHWCFQPMGAARLCWGWDLSSPPPPSLQLFTGKPGWQPASLSGTWGGAGQGRAGSLRLALCPGSHPAAWEGRAGLGAVFCPGLAWGPRHSSITAWQLWGNSLGPLQLTWLRATARPRGSFAPSSSQLAGHFFLGPAASTRFPVGPAERRSGPFLRHRGTTAGQLAPRPWLNPLP